MPTLDWIGKSKVVNHHLDVPYRVLNRKYSYDETGQRETDNGSDNMIIHGDNLLALKSLLPQYEGRVDCIYIDPPYNTGNENWVYNDNVNDPQIKKWLGEVVGSEGEDLSRHDKWLCMMYPRLKLLHRLLCETGIILVSIDEHELHNLLFIMDEIFGRDNRVEIIVWEKKAGAKGVPPRTMMVNVHEYIVAYQKAAGFKFLGEKRDTESEGFKNPDNDPRGPWRMSNIKSTTKSSKEAFTIVNPETGQEYTNTWAFSKESLERMIQEKRILWKKTLPKQKEFLYEMTNENKAIKSSWGVFDAQSTTVLLKQLISSIKFDNPKPINLLDRIIEVSTKKDAIILDSFAGSGTTAHAVLNTNKKDGGNRTFILIELMDYAEALTAERIKRDIRGYGEGEKAFTGKGGSFSYYELGEPLMNDGLLNENVGVDKIREYVYFTETKQKLLPDKEDEPFFLGRHAGNAYYFYYRKDSLTTLDREFLHTVRTKSEGYVIYADLCTLSCRELERYHITYKKIPRDISKL